MLKKTENFEHDGGQISPRVYRKKGDEKLLIHVRLLTQFCVEVCYHPSHRKTYIGSVEG